MIGKKEINYKAKTKHAIKWNVLLSFSTKITAFVVGVVLARLLVPKDYGLMAMSNVFLGFFAVFINGGTASSVIQKKKISQTDLSTIFFYNTAIGLLVSLIVFFMASPIAAYYNEPKVKAIVQAIAWIPLINSISIVQQNLMLRNINFRSKVISQLAGQFLAGAIGILFAFWGYGVWALVLSSIVSSLFSGILYWIQGGWIPSLKFDKDSFKETWSYSSKILYANLMNITFLRIDLILLGKFLNPTFLGLYYKGKSFADIPTSMTNEILTKSYFPILSRLDIKKEFNKFYISQAERILILSTFVFTYLIVTGDEIIKLLYGEQWVGAIVFFKLACAYGFFRANNSFSSQAINALGRSDLNFKKILYLTPVRVGLILLPFIFPKLMNGEFFLFVLILSFAMLEIIANFDVSRLQALPFRKIAFKHAKYITFATLIIVVMSYDGITFKNNYYILTLKTAVYLFFWFILSLFDPKVKGTISLTLLRRMF